MTAISRRNKTTLIKMLSLRIIVFASLLVTIEVLIINWSSRALILSWSNTETEKVAGSR